MAFADALRPGASISRERTGQPDVGPCGSMRGYVRVVDLPKRWWFSSQQCRVIAEWYSGSATHSTEKIVDGRDLADHVAVRAGEFFAQDLIPDLEMIYLELTAW